MKESQFHILISTLFLLGYHLDGNNGFLLVISLMWLIMAILSTFMKSGE